MIHKNYAIKSIIPNNENFFINETTLYLPDNKV